MKAIARAIQRTWTIDWPQDHLLLIRDSRSQVSNSSRSNERENP